ncbi:MAG: bifunctional folylpolyglutamate synthase/dihydrofolate synthase [Muribaculum sp.]|nr:bifunctional folylpolyglutamate synthase/dihydrofolate synthase [Muribaculum sp.]
MDYNSTLEWLFQQLPMFSRTGGAAYKPGLKTSQDIDAHFGHPHEKFKSIHIGGTNGKGSTSHTIAAILQSQGYKTGLYTSPHLVDFRERIRVNGKMIPKEDVIDFVERYRTSGYEGHPSFFELTMMMAFDYFAKEKVDYAVIEVGMGGRLDSTNIITPILSVITNISKDHTQFLGNTLEAIAAEKAGIIKAGVPAVVGEAKDSIREVFQEKASEEGTTILFAEDFLPLQSCQENPEGGLDCKSPLCGDFHCELGGDYQKKNINTVLASIYELQRIGVDISEESIRKGMEEVCELTGLAGRWMKLSDSPLTVCDTGHNEAGLRYTMEQLERTAKAKNGKKHLVIGFVADKAIDDIIELLPRDAEYYFTQAAIPRALPVADLQRKFHEHGIEGNSYPTPKDAATAARQNATANDVIYIGGSTFIVADYLVIEN